MAALIGWSELQRLGRIDGCGCAMPVQDKAVAGAGSLVHALVECVQKEV